MKESTNAGIQRSEDTQWQVIASGDNGIELLQHTIKATDLRDAARITMIISKIVSDINSPKLLEDTQISLRFWRVEVTISAPVGAWKSDSQRMLVARIAACFH